jgi:CheY-like chemotaxis protein
MEQKQETARRVLVVEDDPFLINAYAMKLEHEGYTVEMANDGQQALASVKEVRPDLIILDLIMPVMDGFTTLERLKADPGTKDIPVIVASNLGDDENIQKGLSLGAFDYLLKSDTSIDTLSQKVDAYFGKESQTE